jgi:tetratricopeptide (TPR) repeat protein
MNKSRSFVSFRMRVSTLSAACAVVLFFAPASLCADTQGASSRTPRTASDYYALGRELMNKGDYAGADDAFRRAQALLAPVTPSPVARTTVPVSQAATDTRRKAQVPLVAPVEQQGIAYYSDAVKKNPRNADLYYNLAVEYIKQKQYPDAAITLKRVLYLNPKDKDACYNLGVLYENYLGDKREALQYYGLYVKYAPKAPDRWQVEAWVRQIREELSEDKKIF